MGSQTYIADADDTGRIYLDLDPTPLPLLKYPVTGSSRRTLNARNLQNNLVSGVYHHYSGGSHISGAFIDIGILKMSRTDYSGILLKLTDKNRGQVVFSWDGGITRYLCMVSPSTKPPSSIDGTELIEWALKLDVLEQL